MLPHFNLEEKYILLLGKTKLQPMQWRMTIGAVLNSYFLVLLIQAIIGSWLRMCTPT